MTGALQKRGGGGGRGAVPSRPVTSTWMPATALRRLASASGAAAKLSALKPSSVQVQHSYDFTMGLKHLLHTSPTSTAPAGRGWICGGIGSPATRSVCVAL